ncbi:ABC transporter ATP-binding protein [Paenibacillus sp. YN15]|uniref:ABC transporter ATP-binding protein n=1 Tax=Paenibacillus sp. YN15 TaxID=1742774 RepID=UPI0026D8C716
MKSPHATAGTTGSRPLSTFRLFMGLIRYTPWLYSWNLLNWILITLVPILPGLVTKEFFDVLTGESATGFNVATVIALLLASAMARVAAIIVGFLSDVHFRFRAAGLLRRNMLEHILREPGAKAIPGSPGEAISQFRDDVEQVEEAVSWSVDAVSMVFFAAISIYILAGIDAQMTLWVFLPLVVVVALAQLSTGWLQKYRAASREATSQVTGAISEMFTSVQAIQVAGAEERVIGQFRELNDTRRKSMLKDKLFSQALDSVFSNTVNLGTGFILILAGQKMQNGSFQVGDFALFVYYLNFVTTFIQNFGKFLTYYKQSAVSAKRMSALLQGAPGEKLIRKAPLYLSGTLPDPGELAAQAAPDEANAGAGAASSLTLEQLKVEGLTYLYPATGRGIQDINFTLEKETFTVITGRIGSGKTTLVRALLGLLPSDSGNVLWNGYRVEDPGNFFVPPRSAYTPQVPRLYSDTLTENILLGLPHEGGRLPAAVHAAVLEHDVEELHLGLDTVIGPRGVKLSGGQAQRAAAARMFAREAQLYVFDDLSSALDVETEQKLWERLFARRRAACLVVSHRKAVLQHADRILLLKDGRLHASGTLAELLASNEEMRRLWSGEIS